MQEASFTCSGAGMLSINQACKAKLAPQCPAQGWRITRNALHRRLDCSLHGLGWTPTLPWGEAPSVCCFIQYMWIYESNTHAAKQFPTCGTHTHTHTASQPACTSQPACQPARQPASQLPESVNSNLSPATLQAMGGAKRRAASGHGGCKTTR